MRGMWGAYELYRIGTCRFEGPRCASPARRPLVRSLVRSLAHSSARGTRPQTPTLKAREPSDRESIVYVFGCLEEACGGSKGSWRVFRWTEVSASASASAVADGDADGGRDAATAEEPPAPSSSTWGLGDGGLEDALDLGDLSAQLQDLLAGHDSATTTSSKQRDSKRREQRQQQKQRGERNSEEAFEGRIPAFYLVYSADIPPTMGIDSDDEEEARYGRADSINSRNEDNNNSGSGDEGAGEADGEWGGEAYERDTVIRARITNGKGTSVSASASVDSEAAFVAYMKELSRVPDQCVRVYAGGAGVPYAWPTNSVRRDLESSLACPRCGASRRCAAQIMSPIIVAITEGLEMVDAEERRRMRVPPLSWDWATLAVMVCDAECVEEAGDSVLVEEEVLAIGEA